jgi:hypothetical protein
MIIDYKTAKERIAPNKKSNFVFYMFALAISLTLFAHIIYMHNRLNLDKCVAFNFPNNEAVIDCYFNN